MPRKGQTERLSKLQKEILRYCKQKYLEDIESHSVEEWARRIHTRSLYKCVAKNMGIGYSLRGKYRFWWHGWCIPNSFESSVSRSLRNLIKKEIIENFEPHAYGMFRITDKGKTLMLRVES